MRVVVIGLNYQPEPTGIAPYTTAMARGLAERGDQVRAVTAMPHYPEWRIHDGYDGGRRREHIDGVDVLRLRHYVPTRPSGVRRLLSEVSFGLRVLISRWGRADVVVLVSPALFATAIAMVRARIARTPVVVWVQDLYSLGIVETHGNAAGGGVARIIRSVESAVARSASRIVVIHDRFAHVATELGARPDRVAVVRNWTHLKPAVSGDPQVAREELGWGAEETVVLHSGAMGHKQDLDNVLAAARIADQRGSAVRFVLMGNGGERARLQAAASGIRSLTFLDPLPGEQYQAALRAADVLLVNEHAGLREMAVPSKLTSYFSSGRPVVAATDAGSVTAAEVKAAQAGLRVEPGDPAALLEAAEKLGTERERAAALGRNGQRYQERVLSEQVAIDRFRTLLHDVVREARSSRRHSQEQQVAAESAGATRG